VVDQDEIHRMAQSEKAETRNSVVYMLHSRFSDFPDKEQAWSDLIGLTQDMNSETRRAAVNGLHLVFSHVPNKNHAWSNLIRLTQDEDIHVRWSIAYTLGTVFPHIPDKEQAWTDLHQLTLDKNIDVKWGVLDVLGSAFSHIPNKEQAWADLHQLAQDKDSGVRWGVADAICSAFSYIPDKDQAWDDLFRLTQDKDIGVRMRATDALGSALPNIPDKKQAWNELILLTEDENIEVRVYAYHSLGRVSVFRATVSKNEEVFKDELENALRFFEMASKEDLYFGNPASFCLPFYRSFYVITFKKHEAEAEVRNYLDQAGRAVGGSESKQKLLEAVENLSNALLDVKKMREMGLEAMRCDLNTYRQYCERASELLETTGEKAPAATRLIKKGFPIIDERIKEIIAEIQEKASGLCRQMKDTPFQALGKEVNQIGKTFLQIKDPIGLEKSVQNMMIALSQICAELPERERGNACDLLKKAKEEPYVEDKLDLINMVISKLPPQIGGMKKTIIVNQYGNGDRFYNESVDNSINISGDLATDLETLSALIKRDYSQDDRDEVIQTVKQMKQSCNNQEKKGWLKEKLGWIVTRTSEVASISSFALTLLDKLK